MKHLVCDENKDWAIVGSCSARLSQWPKKAAGPFRQDAGWSQDPAFKQLMPWVIFFIPSKQQPLSIAVQLCHRSVICVVQVHVLRLSGVHRWHRRGRVLQLGRPAQWPRALVRHQRGPLAPRMTERKTSPAFQRLLPGSFRKGNLLDVFTWKRCWGSFIPRILFCSRSVFPVKGKWSRNPWGQHGGTLSEPYCVGDLIDVWPML